MEKKKVPAKIFRQEVIVFLVVIALLIFFCAASPDFRKYTTPLIPLRITSAHTRRYGLSYGTVSRVRKKTYPTLWI